MIIDFISSVISKVPFVINKKNNNKIKKTEKDQKTSDYKDSQNDKSSNKNDNKVDIEV